VLSCLYAAPSVSLLTHLVSIGTWVLNFGLVLLVPMDVYLTAFNEGEEDSARKEQVAGWYLLMYWLVYLLTWTVVPVVQEWEDSGDLSSLDRLKRSLRSNGSFYLYMLVFGVVFLVAVFFLYPDLFNSKDLLKAMGYCYGMFVLMVLLSYSVLQLPAWLFRLSSPAAKLSLYRSYHSKAQEELQESIFGI
jgi:magnesium-transporting ATPase (P-type)